MALPPDHLGAHVCFSNSQVPGIVAQKQLQSLYKPFTGEAFSTILHYLKDVYGPDAAKAAAAGPRLAAGAHHLYSSALADAGLATLMVAAATGPTLRGPVPGGQWRGLGGQGRFGGGGDPDTGRQGHRCRRRPLVPPTAAGAESGGGGAGPVPWRQGILWRRRPRRLTQGRPARRRRRATRRQEIRPAETAGEPVLQASGRRAGTDHSYSTGPGHRVLLHSTCTGYEQ